MPTPPRIVRNAVDNPHLVILGAGASRAACPKGDVNGRKLPLMKDFISTLNLEPLLTKAGIDTAGNFEIIYQEIASRNDLHDLRIEVEERTHTYFSSLRLPDQPNLYDYLVLSLREKDVIATFNWDPFLLQAFRRNAKIKRLPRLSFLHGNTAVGVCITDKVVGFLGNPCSKCLQPLSPSRLLYPVGNKNYNSDPAIADEWAFVTQTLSDTYFLTIFGYNAPDTDAEAKKLFLDAWKANPMLELAEVEIIDIQSKTTVEQKWAPFFYSHHFRIEKRFATSQLARFPRRSCDEFGIRTLLLDFYEENSFPTFSTLDQLHSWVQPLLEDEDRFSNGAAFTFKAAHKNKY